MAGENELLEAEGIDPNATNTELEQPTHDLQIEDTTKTGVESLDKRLEELASGTNRGANETSKADDKSKLPAGQTTLQKTAQTQQQPQTNTQQQQPSVGVGGFAGKAPKAYGARFNWDSKGNVIDKTTGGVIAAAGAERKAFERMIPIINGAATEADKFKGMYESAIKANTVASSLNLTPEEFSLGARIMANWKSSPKKVLDYLIKEAQNNGVDVSDLGVQGGGGLSRADVEAIVEQVAKKTIEPFSFITSEREEARQQREALNEAQGVIEEFYTSRPDAKIHEESLALIMNAKEGTSLETAYYILKNHALESKLDWTKDLIPQVQALVSKQQPNGRVNSNGQPAIPQRLPNVNGRANSEALVPRRTGAAPGSTSSGDIVKEAMREAGMNVDNI